MSPLALAAIKAVFEAGIDLEPYLAQLVSKGQITIEQQSAALSDYQSLRSRDAGQFDGPEWKVVE
jgi:hypothetical protein